MKKLALFLIMMFSTICMATPYSISTVYDSNTIWNIQYAQADNIMYLVDGNNPPQKLTRFAHTTWTIEDVNFTTGPFLPENTTTTTITPSDVNGSITLQASSDIFQSATGASHIGSIWEIQQQRGSTLLSGTLDANESSANSGYFTGGYSFTTSGTWNATVTLERSTDSGATWNAALTPLNSTNFDNRAQNEDTGAIYRVTMTDYVSGSCKYTFLITDRYVHGIVRITAVTDANTAVATVLTELASTAATTKWREGYWSDYRGWPKTVEFIQQRIVYGGSRSYPQTLWFGRANPYDYENFAEGTLATSAFTAVLCGQNPIQWLLPEDYLFIGTSESVGRFGEAGASISPTSPSYREQAKVGSASIKAVLAGSEIIYIERGRRNVNGFAYSLEQDKYNTIPLTILSENITESGIKDITFQARPIPVLWCVLNDGNMAVLTYLPKQEIIGWAKFHTDGNFESVTSIPGSSTNSEDEVWAIVKRMIDGNEVRYVEQFQPLDWGSDPNHCWFIDSCPTSYSSTATTYITGLDHLIGKTVAVYADCVIFPSKVVDVNGGIVLSRAASHVTAGLPYTSKLETMPVNFETPLGSIAPMSKKAKTVDVDFYKTGYCQYGNGKYSTLTNINFGNDLNIDPNAVAQPLYTSDGYSVKKFDRLNFVYGPRKKLTLYFESAKPMPLTIRALYPDIEVIP